MNTSIPQLQLAFTLPLDQFDLNVEYTTTQQVTGVFGVSGAGKTSLLETVAGIRRNARGRICFGGEAWLDSTKNISLPAHHRNIGYVPQDSLLFPHKNVRQNLLAGSKRAHRNQQQMNELLDRVTRLLNIADLLSRQIDTLSGGERQRVALGRAICSGPGLLLLDEPLASLDIALRYKILPFLHRIKEEFHIPILLVSHDPIDVQALCDDLLVLREGAILAQGKPRRVLTNPEIFPVADREGYQNIFQADVDTHDGETSVLRMGEGDSPIRIITPRVSGAPGEKLLVGIAAYDIILGNQRPEGLSARNILQARITDIQSTGTLNLVTVTLAQQVPNLVVEVTEQSCREMNLVTGKEVYLIIKTASWRILEEVD